MRKDSADRHIHCPDCRFREAYRLADGRRKCVRCGRKYTPRPLRSRLSARTLRQVVLFFWLMVPAGQAAKELKLNRKTVQRHYRLIRQAIGRRGGQGWEGEGKDVSSGEGRGDETPIAGLVLSRQMVRILPRSVAFGQGIPPDALVCTRTSRPFRGRSGLGECYLHISGAAQKEGHADEMIKFWQFVQRMEKTYGGRRERDFTLFMQEAAFRFNQRDNPKVIATLSQLLRRGGK